MKMEYKVEEFYFKSSNGANDIHAKILSPMDTTKIRGIIQVCHGMCEFFDKYMDFYTFLIEQNFVVCGHDMLGHGKSAKRDSDKGFFAEKDGYKYLIRDAKKMTTLVRKRYPNQDLFLMGHSMGSLIARNYASKYGKNLSGLILCGTVGPQPLIDSAIKIANLIIRRKGERYRSRVLYKIFNDFANLGFKEKKTLAWTTSDIEELEKTESHLDELFIFTASGFKDLFRLVKYANAEKVIETIPKSLPIFFFSGTDDPIGEKGLGVKRAYKLYQKAKIQNVTIKLYPKGRHEMLKEVNRNDVFHDILKWIEKVEDGKKNDN